MAELRVDLDVVCTCGKVLDTTDAVRDQITVSPCEACLSEAEKEGRRLGYDDGYGDGYGEGFNDGMEEIEE